MTSSFPMEDGAERGMVRFNDSDEAEVFDGKQWRLYRELPPDDLDTQFRTDPEDEGGEITSEV